MAGLCVSQRRCQATGKLLFSPYTGQLGAHIPSLLVRCHKPFIGRSVARLKQINTRPPSSHPHPRSREAQKGLQRVRVRKRARGSRDARGPCGACSAREGIFVRRLLVHGPGVWSGSAPSARLELLRMPAPKTIPTLSFSGSKGKPRQAEQPARRGRKLLGGQLPGSGLRSPPPNPGSSLAPRPAPRAPSPCPRDGSRTRTPAWVVRAGADSPGRARRGAAAAFSAADKVSQAPSGHRSGSRSGRSSPGRAAGGGRGCGRQGCGERRGMGPERASAGAASSRRPRRSPRPVPPPARLRCGASGPGRAERREIVSTANKKRRHMTRQEEGKRGEGGAEGAGETENVGWATPGCGAGPQGGPLARLGSRAPVQHPGDPGKPGRWRVAGPLPCFGPHGRCCAAGNVSPQRFYPGRLPYKARK